MNLRVQSGLMRLTIQYWIEKCLSQEQTANLPPPGPPRRDEPCSQSFPSHDGQYLEDASNMRIVASEREGNAFPILPKKSKCLLLINVVVTSPYLLLPLETSVV